MQVKVTTYTRKYFSNILVNFSYHPSSPEMWCLHFDLPQHLAIFPLLYRNLCIISVLLSPTYLVVAVMLFAF